MPDGCLAFLSFAGAAGIGIKEKILQIGMGVCGFLHGGSPFKKDYIAVYAGYDKKCAVFS